MAFFSARNTHETYELRLVNGSYLQIRPLIKNGLLLLKTWEDQHFVNVGTTAALEVLLKKKRVHAVEVSVDEEIIGILVFYDSANHEVHQFFGLLVQDRILEVLYPNFNYAQVKTMMELIVQWYYNSVAQGTLYSYAELFDHRGGQLLKETGFTFVRNLVLSRAAVSLFAVARR